MKRRCWKLSALLLTFVGTAQAQQTTAYSYDAKGRLIKATNSGGSNSSTTTYQHDKADNRARLTTSGAAGTAAQSASTVK